MDSGLTDIFQGNNINQINPTKLLVSTPVPLKRNYYFLGRVELEHLSGGLAVVHNYGHCGYGVLSSPGTSQQAVQIVKTVIGERKSRM